MNIVFGLCGEGLRYQIAGYQIPKYLVAFNGAPMIYHAVDSLKIPGRIYFVVKTDHLKQYPYLKKMLLSIGDEIIPCHQPTQGAADTLMLAKSYIKNLNDPFISVNCDQVMKWNSNNFIKEINSNSETSYIITYPETNPNYSYVKHDSLGQIVEVREKKVISNDATIGVYHWAHSSDFFIDAESMINSGTKEHNEYYVAPVYNYSIKRNLKVKSFNITQQEFNPVGTPSELQTFLTNHNSDE